MLILGLECSGNACSVALVQGDRVLASRFIGECQLQATGAFFMRRSAETLMFLAQGLFFASTIEARKLQRVTVTCGPGSFTGIRAGLSAAHAFAFVASCTIVALSTFDVLAFMYRQRYSDAPLRVLLPSSAGYVYAQDYDAGTAQGAREGMAEKTIEQAVKDIGQRVLVLPPVLATYVPAVCAPKILCPQARDGACLAGTLKDEGAQTVTAFYGKDPYAR